MQPIRIIRIKLNRCWIVPAIIRTTLFHYQQFSHQIRKDDPLKYALKANAAQIILAHNHPSGNLKPSDADLSITKKIKEGAKQLDIIVLDHIILTVDAGYYSFAEEGDL